MAKTQILFLLGPDDFGCAPGVEGSDGPDRITRTVYDAAGQVLQIRRAVGTPIEIADVTYTYTLNGQIENVIDANGNRAELRYDAFDRQTDWVFPSKVRPTAFDDTDYASAIATAGDLSTDDGNAATELQGCFKRFSQALL